VPDEGGLPAQQAIAIVVAVLVAVGWALYLFANTRRARREVGSEIELAANRKPYLDDEELEGPKLDRALRWGLISLTIVGVGLPLYWLAEPGRQSGATNNFDERFAGTTYHHGQPVGGGALFAATDQGGFNCAGCHGGDEGLGAEVPYTLSEPVLDEDGDPVIDEETGETETKLRQVQWRAPALNTVTLRMTDEQLRDVLTYGRPFSPMPAWGIEGGGPLNEQQIDNLIAYLHTIQISEEEAREQAEEAARAEQDRLAGLRRELTEAEEAAASAEGDEQEAAQEEVDRIEAELAVGQTATYGAALYNTNCARCHTAGWSYGEPEEPGGGAMGPPLTNVLTQFPFPEDHVEWVTNGVETGEQYGRYGQNEGRMPFFGRQLSREQISAIIRYEREELSEPATRQPIDETEQEQ
jgi:mono/diheme cytochrome c family protein